MAIESGTPVRLVNRERWKTWGWLIKDSKILRVLLEPDRVYTVTVVSSRFKRTDGTWQPVTKMICQTTGVEVMAPRDSIEENM